MHVKNAKYFFFCQMVIKIKNKKTTKQFLMFLVIAYTITNN